MRPMCFCGLPRIEGPDGWECVKYWLHERDEPTAAAPEEAPADEGEKGWHLGERTRVPTDWIVAYGGGKAGQEWEKAKRADAEDFEREHPLQGGGHDEI